MHDGAPKFPEGQRIELSTHTMQIRWLRVWVVLLTVLAALGPIAGVVGYYRANQAVSENCARIHAIVQVGTQIIGDPDAQGRPGKTLRQYRDAGTITRKQYAVAIRGLERRLARWRSADCPPPKLFS
jgi:hypothetical protein